jgi:hypothetical protein
MDIDRVSIREFIYDLINAKNVDDVIKAWNNFDDDFSEYKSIITLEEYKENKQSKEIINVLLKCRDCVSYYFNTHNAYFISENNIREMFMKGKTDILIDYSIMFDTNFASYIDKFVNNKNMGDATNDVYLVIDMLLSHNFNYDYNIYLFENMKEVINLFSDEDISYDESLVECLISMELFKSINIDVYKKHNKIQYGITYTEAKSKANKIINLFYRDEQVLKYAADIISSQKFILLNIIEIFKIHFSKNYDAKKKTLDFLDFVNKKSGLFMERETVIALEFFCKNNMLSIFNGIQLNMNREKLFKKLDNIAWDFMIPRLMERSIILGGEGDFFLPLLLSFDKGVHRLLKLYPVKGIIYKKESLEYFPIPQISSYELFKQKGIGDLSELIDDFQVRKEIMKKTKMNIDNIIENELRALEKIMYK